MWFGNVDRRIFRLLNGEMFDRAPNYLHTLSIGGKSSPPKKTDLKSPEKNDAVIENMKEKERERESGGNFFSPLPSVVVKSIKETFFRNVLEKF